MTPPRLRKATLKEAIRLRACLAVVQGGRILLVPHYDIDEGPVQWHIPGGGVEFGEGLELAALREFTEKTGLEARIDGVLTVGEVIVPEWSSHIVTVIFMGAVTSIPLAAEAEESYTGEAPQWFSAEELQTVDYRPKGAVDKALSLRGPDASADR